MGIIKRVRRGKVRWFARWWSGGREHWQAAPTRAAAVGLLGKRRVEVFEGREFPGKRRRCTTTVNALLADYIAAVRREKTKATADAYGFYAAHVRHAALGKRLIVEVGDLDVAGYKKAQLGEKHPPSPATLNRELTLLRAAFNQAVERGTIVSNPFRKVKMLRESPGRTRMLSAEEESRLLDACAPRLRAIVTVALHTALRRGEIAGLTWGDVDLAAGFVQPRRSGPGATKGTKTHDTRGVPMNDTLRHLFTSLRPREVDAEALVFATRSGKPYANVRRDFAAACDRARVRDFRFHDTRHTAASRLVMDGASLRAVAEILGHRTLRMVMRYAHLSPAHMQETVGRLDGWTDRSGTVTQTVTRVQTPPRKAAKGRC